MHSVESSKTYRFVYTILSTLHQLCLVREIIWIDVLKAERQEKSTIENSVLIMEDAKALTDNAIDAVPLEEVDYNVRYSLMLVGVISGRQRRIDQYKQLCYAVNVLHTLVCVMCTVNLLMCLILGWDDEDDANSRF